MWDCDERVFMIVVSVEQEEKGNGAKEDSPSISSQGVPASSGGEAYQHAARRYQRWMLSSHDCYIRSEREVMSNHLSHCL